MPILVKFEPVVSEMFDIMYARRTDRQTEGDGR